MTDILGFSAGGRAHLPRRCAVRRAPAARDRQTSAAVAEAFVYTDPACPYSWAGEPAVRRLEAEFGDGLSLRFVMGGLAREFKRPLETMRHWIDAGAESGMPVDPRLWL